MYIHYGCDHFDFDRLNKQYLEVMDNFCNQNNFLNKPPVGLWASPVTCNFSWKDWCEGEDFHTDRLDKSFTFTLTDSAKVLVVRSMDDVKEYIATMLDNKDFLYHTRFVDFKKIMGHYDAMELCHDDNYMELHSYPGMFNSWDVDSIVVWNPKVVREIKIGQIAS